MNRMTRVRYLSSYLEWVSHQDFKYMPTRRRLYAFIEHLWRYDGHTYIVPENSTNAIFLKSWRLTHSKYDDRYLTLAILFTPVTLVTLFRSYDQFYRAECITVSGFFEVESFVIHGHCAKWHSSIWQFVLKIREREGQYFISVFTACSFLTKTSEAKELPKLKTNFLT